MRRAKDVGAAETLTLPDHDAGSSAVLRARQKDRDRDQVGLRDSTCSLVTAR